MATFRDLGIVDATFVAGANFSACPYQFVSAGSVVGEVVLATGTSNPAPIGIIQNNPSTGQEARVRVMGYSKLVCETNGTCDLNWRRWVFCASDGQGEPLVAGCPVNALYLDANLTSAGSVVARVYLLPMTASQVGAAS